MATGRQKISELNYQQILDMLKRNKWLVKFDSVKLADFAIKLDDINNGPQEITPEDIKKIIGMDDPHFLDSLGLNTDRNSRTPTSGGGYTPPNAVYQSDDQGLLTNRSASQAFVEGGRLTGTVHKANGAFPSQDSRNFTSDPRLNNRDIRNDLYVNQQRGQHSRKKVLARPPTYDFAPSWCNEDARPKRREEPLENDTRARTETAMEHRHQLGRMEQENDSSGQDTEGDEEVRPYRAQHYERDRPRNQRNRRMPAPPKTLYFDGTSNFEVFEWKFCEFVEMEGLDFQQSLYALGQCLGKNPGEYFQRQKNRGKYRNATEALYDLRNMFGEDDSEIQANLALSNAVQGEKEDVRNFMDRLHNLAAKAMRDSPQRVIERTAVVRFCSGLSDKEIGQYVSCNTVYTMQDALTLYNRFNQSRILVRGPRKSTKFEINQTSILKKNRQFYADEGEIEDTENRCHVRQNRPSQENKNNTDMSALAEALNKLTTEIAGMRNDLKKNTELLETRINRPLERPRSPNRSRSPYRSASPGGPRLCWDCGQPGHFRGDSTCPMSDTKEEVDPKVKESQESAHL